METKINNRMLILGIIISVAGLAFAAYSFSIYSQTKVLRDKIDFELTDENSGLSTEERYYRYLSIADFLNGKLKKNENLPIKRISCVYFNYAQHNATELYRLTNKFGFDDTKRSVAAGNLRRVYNIADNYKTCANYETYKTGLKNLLDDIQNEDERRLEAARRLNNFLNGNSSEISGKIPSDAENNISEQASAQSLPEDDHERPVSESVLRTVEPKNFPEE